MSSGERTFGCHVCSCFSQKQRTTFRSTLCGPEEKKSSCFQRCFNFNPDMLLAFAPFCHLFCYHRQIQDVALKCSSGASEAAAAGSRASRHNPFLFSPSPFHFISCSLIDSLCDDGAVRESEGWSGEESDVPRCGRQLWEGCDEKIMMLVTFYYTKCGIWQ